MKDLNIPKSIFVERRKKVIEQIGDSTLILPASSEQVRNNDVNHPFRQNSDFIYLSDFHEPDAFILLDGKTKKSILFSKKYDEQHAIWEGEIIGQERAKSEYLFDESFPLESLDETIIKYLSKCDSVIAPFNFSDDFNTCLLSLIKKTKDHRYSNFPKEIIHSDKFIHPMRQIKDKYEIEMMQIASNISIKAHKQAMTQCKPDMTEADIAAIVDYEFVRNKTIPAYGHIVAGGNNACTLHYKSNNQTLHNGSLILIDAGCEKYGYASDITRTFPINGRFTDIQKKAYNWVLKSMEAAFAECKAGNTVRSPHFAAETVLIEAMIDLNLLKGSICEIKENKSYMKYFMHGTSHWLGLDVHDVGVYKNPNNKDGWATLKAGMSITIEPGLYIRKDDMDAPAELRGLGIRIEDDIIITENGYINLTEKAPKTIEEIEKVCNL